MRTASTAIRAAVLMGLSVMSQRMIDPDPPVGPMS